VPHGVLAHDLAPVTAALFPELVRAQQGVRVEPGAVGEDEVGVPLPGVAPDLVGRRLAAGEPLEDLVRGAVPRVDPAAFGAPAGPPGTAALAIVLVRVGDRPVERLPGLVPPGGGIGIPPLPELDQEPAARLDAQRVLVRVEP